MLEKKVAKLEVNYDRGKSTVNIDYHIVGKDNKKTIHLIPGYGFKGDYYNNEKFLNKLVEAGYKVVIAEVCGRYKIFSDSPEDIKEAVESYDAFSRYIGDGYKILIGHSLGATVALEYANKNPEKVEKVVAFEPVLPNQHEDLTKKKAILKHVWNYTMMTFGEMLGRVGDGVKHIKKVQKKSFNIFREYNINLLKGGLKPLKAVSSIVSYELPTEWNYHKPVLLTTVKRSGLFNMYDKVRDGLNQKVSNLKLVEPKDKDHNFPIFYHDYTLKLVLDFLKKN